MDQRVNSLQPVFVLGVERSGSTWVANLVDSNAENILFMEPFAPLNKAFPGFPNRLLYLNASNRFLEDIVREGFQNLYAYKYPFLDRHNASPSRRFLTYQVVYRAGRFQDLAARVLGIGRPLAHVRYKNLNKNRLENKELLYRAKRDVPTHVVTKELRLNFKVKVIRELFPDAKFVVIIRNPLSQIHSMLQQFERGALYQLKRCLYALLEHVEPHPRFAAYEHALDDIDSDRLFDRLVAYWFVNYNTLLDDLSAHEGDYIMIRHEDLSQDPLRHTRDLFAFMGLSLSAATERYVRSSSSSDNTTSSVMDTTRDSQSYYLKATRDVPRSIREDFFEVAEAFWPVSQPAVASYREWLEQHLPA